MIKIKSISINLNEERKEIIDKVKIIPISDLHLGDKLSDLKEFRNVLKKIQEEPNTYTIINGDMCNTALKNSKSDVYNDDMTPMEQLNELINILEPIKEKILVITPGNHENRILKDTSIDIINLLSRQLGIQNRFSSSWWYLYLTFGKNNKDKPITYQITGYHGSGGGRKPGGKINRLEEMSSIVVADLYIMSHTHKPISTKGVIYIPDNQHKVVVRKDLYYLMTNSFLGYDGGYAETMGMLPSNNSIVEAELNGDKKQIRLVL